jgi:2-dehydropantoate 2-reductase
MKIAILGGAGAMGGVFGGYLAQAGNDVALVDVWSDGVAAINAEGLRIQGISGEVRTIPAHATTDPAEVGPVELVMVFVKCYHTESAVRAAARCWAQIPRC